MKPRKDGQQEEWLQVRADGTDTPGQGDADGEHQGHCLSADPASLHNPLETQSQAWRVSLAEAESCPAGWLSSLWREEALNLSPSIHKVQCGEEALEIGSECGWGGQK